MNRDLTDSWICRDYRSGDEHRILDLFRIVFGKELSLQVWKWRFVESPFGRGIIKLLFDGDKLVGHYAVVPMEVKIADSVVKGVFSMTTMTHPDYQGRGIFTTLAEETYKEALRKGAAFVYGFPNRNSYYGFTQKLGWRGFGNMTVWQKDVLEKDIGRLSQRSCVKQISRFEDDVTYLWEKVKQNYIVIVPRTKEYLNWRFVDNPQSEYSRVVCVDDKGEIAGYAVLKIYRSETELKGHIVDMLSIDDPEVVGELLRYAYGFFRNEMVESLSCFCPDNSVWADVLREEGFHRSWLEAAYFGVAPLGKPDRSLAITEDFSAWYLTMGDCDVY